MKISSKLNGLPTIKLSQIEDLQGNLKDLNKTDFEKLKTRIDKHGFKYPLYLWKHKGKYFNLDGNQRKRVIMSVWGDIELPYIEIEAKNEKDAKKEILAISSQYGKVTKDGFDEFAFDFELEDWAEVEMETTFDGWMDKEIEEAEEDNYEEPDDLKVDVVLGDLIEIGEHRLICGDSTDSDAVAKLMDGEKSEMLFTSPPYSDMREYNGDKDLSIDYLIDFIPTFLPYAEYQVINLGLQRKDHEIVQYWDEYIKKAKDCGYKFLSWNIWDREMATSIGSQTAFIPIWHEWIFVFGKDVKEINRTKKNRTPGSRSGTNRQKDGSLKKSTSITKNWGKIGTVTKTGVANGKYHPAEFPVEFPSIYINAMSNEGDIVTDSFLGSGTTMVAAHQLNRKCYGMELDPRYCQVIIDRMKKLDPNLEVKINGEVYAKKEAENVEQS